VLAEPDCNESPQASPASRNAATSAA
jgi:hypothetical protein